MFIIDSVYCTKKIITTQNAIDNKWIMYAELFLDIRSLKWNEKSIQVGTGLSQFTQKKSLQNYRKNPHTNFIFTNSTIFSLFYFPSPKPNKNTIMIDYRVSFIFGAITMTAGIIGVPLGSYLSTNFIKRSPRIDPVICAVGLLVSAPLLAFSIFFITESPLAAYIAVFFGQVALNCNWAVVADMLLVRFFTYNLVLVSFPHMPKFF